MPRQEVGPGKVRSMGRRHGQLGLSLVELMVGITVGMIVVAGASMMLTQQLNEHRRLVLETQVQQDLRAAADLMLRELRRGGAHAMAENMVWVPAATAAGPITNDYASQTSVAQAQNEVDYSYSVSDSRVGGTPLYPEDNVSSSNEHFGFRLDGQTLQFKQGNGNAGGNWQALTDPATLLITAFTVQPNIQNLSLQDMCEKTCPVVTATCPPQLLVKRFDITLTGVAAHDANVVRTLRVSSKMRNDEVIGACPP
ncbi:PilW family protein [Roseateles koreensis]|uniref:Prepilin-type N-terminal cleavage/methylation domain-containing protein n=1 Tax=Roseateles koreensis TaxID=2987526 RepID=A0ABT5KQ25_9BURK|nr:prepilin-type N-terminal cleavage/methylation domain-containing protein [Roseateles koreensis]MDC8784478.1 prepilin-type N-terminal cleavage/methylation domain-containing protein [Roseateles koreensis]